MLNGFVNEGMAYLQPFLHWMHQHPHWTAFFTFWIASSESFVILGALIPGSTIIAALGVLAGSGVLRIDLIFLASTLGAITGDASSYFLGYYFRDSIVNMWPFSRNPQWLLYGRQFFEKYGGLSVCMGRFLGPLRAITPITAGMMRMPKGRFFVANVLSAIGWSALYIFPGVLVGAASAEYMPNGKQVVNICLFILGVVILLWLLLILLAVLLRKRYPVWQKILGGMNILSWRLSRKK
ncbi:MAG: DedA family protein [Legionellaceae bacterium]|nr:DedA family protein [Legionellaceae bacterium]